MIVHCNKHKHNRVQHLPHLNFKIRYKTKSQLGNLNLWRELLIHCNLHRRGLAPMPERSLTRLQSNTRNTDTLCVTWHQLNLLLQNFNLHHCESYYRVVSIHSGVWSGIFRSGVYQRRHEWCVLCNGCCVNWDCNQIGMHNGHVGNTMESVCVRI